MKTQRETSDNKNIQKLLQIILLYFLYTIPNKVVFKDFCYFLGTVIKETTDQNNSLLFRTISIICMMFTSSSRKENSCSKSFYKTEAKKC